jgi:hypothetical protein
VLTATPARLARAPAARALWRAVVPEAREQAFAKRTGVEPLQVEELVVIDLEGEGYLMLARGPFEAAEVVRRLGQGLAIVDVSVDTPRVRREGLRGQGRYAYAALDHHGLLVARDAPPELVASVLQRADGKLAHGAFASPLSADLRRAHGVAPLVVYNLSPLSLPSGTGAALLLSREKALAVAVVPGAELLSVSVDLRGELPPGAEANLRTWARSVGGSDLGRVLGLGEVADQMAIRVDESGALVTFQLDAEALLSGVRFLFFDEMRVLFE